MSLFVPNLKSTKNRVLDLSLILKVQKTVSLDFVPNWEIIENRVLVLCPQILKNKGTRTCPFVLFSKTPFWDVPPTRMVHPPYRQ